MTVSEQQYGASTWLCDYLVESQLSRLQPKQVVDFGAGAGKNGKMIKRVLGGSCFRVAVEGFQNTAAMLRNCDIYDRVDESLIQGWLERDSDHYSVALFGDVIEHLTPREIHASLKVCLRKFDHIIIVVPLHDIFQDEAYGNPLEVHKSYITHDFFDRYHPVEKHIVEGAEFTMMNLLIPCAREKKPLSKRTMWRLFHVSMLALQPLGLARPTVEFLKRTLSKYKSLIR